MGLTPNQRLNVQTLTESKEVLVVRFAKSLASYLQIRTRQVSIFTVAAAEVILFIVSGLKSWLVRRMFWGRSSLYRTTFHLIVSIITISAVLSGVSTRLNIISASETEGLDLNSGILGKQDILSQSGTGESISIVSSNEPDYPVYKHIVQSGETLSEIAEIYKIKSSTIRWANNMSNDTIRPGQVLRIPGIDGAFVKVQRGDTLEKIASRNKGNVGDILDLNSGVLDTNNLVLKEGMELFIPGGEIPLPRVVAVSRSGSSGSSVVSGPNAGVNLPPGTFINPLSNCPGYTYIRGFTSWHDGVDLAKPDGCWINAAGAGKVVRAGWGSAGQGFHVQIDHGNGIHTFYFHGQRRFAVKVGDIVKPGQSILYMGCSGNCRGPHLHLELAINGRTVNPEYYMKVR